MDYLTQLKRWKSPARKSKNPLNTDQLLSEWKLSSSDLLQESPSVPMQTLTLLPCRLLLEQFSLFRKTEVIVWDLTSVVVKLAVVMNQVR